MGINPFVGFIEPHLPVAFGAPTGSCGSRDLVGWMAVQIITWRNQRERLLVVIGFANKEIEKLHPFVPPMTEQFGIIRREHQGRPVHNLGETCDLSHSGREEMVCVFISGTERGFSAV